MEEAMDTDDDGDEQRGIKDWKHDMSEEEKDYEQDSGNNKFDVLVNDETATEFDVILLPHEQRVHGGDVDGKHDNRGGTHDGRHDQMNEGENEVIIEERSDVMPETSLHLWERRQVKLWNGQELAEPWPRLTSDQMDAIRQSDVGVGVDRVSVDVGHVGKITFDTCPAVAKHVHAALQHGRRWAGGSGGVGGANCVWWNFLVAHDVVLVWLEAVSSFCLWGKESGAVLFDVTRRRQG